MSRVYPKVLSKGNLVDRLEAMELIQEVSKEQIDIGMFVIKDDKSLGVDDYNAKYFKKCWPIVREDIYDAIINFFSGKTNISSWNDIIRNLFPKGSHVNRVKDFRSILCCTMVYNIIAKILAVRL